MMRAKLSSWLLGYGSDRTLSSGVPGSRVHTIRKVLMKFYRLMCLALPLATLAGAVTLAPSAASPAPLGTVVTFDANAGSGASFFYRFRTRRVIPTLARDNSEVGYRTVVDYGPKSSFTWA